MNDILPMEEKVRRMIDESVNKTPDEYIALYKAGKYEEMVTSTYKYIVKLMKNYNIVYNHPLFCDVFFGCVNKLYANVERFTCDNSFMTYAHFIIRSAIKIEILNSHRIRNPSFNINNIDIEYLYLDRDNEDFYDRISSDYNIYRHIDEHERISDIETIKCILKKENPHYLKAIEVIQEQSLKKVNKRQLSESQLEDLKKACLVGGVTRMKPIKFYYFARRILGIKIRKILKNNNLSEDLVDLLY